MKRRRFSALAASVAASAWPARSGAQQKAMPVVGWLNAGRPGATDSFLKAFREGLAETGFVEGQNVAIEYRWGEDHYDRLPALAAELIARKVDVLATVGGPDTARAARQATSTIPIVFGTGSDPVAGGFVASLARPGGNITGVNYLVSEMGPKRLDMISQAAPQAKLIAFFVNPKNPYSERAVREMEDAARPRGLQLLVLKIGVESDVDDAFAAIVRQRAGALVIQADPFVHSQRDRLIALAARHAVPAIYTWREFAEVGGLIAYGPSLAGVYRQIGNYVGRILKGAKPADLPMVQPTTFELLVNMKTAKALGLSLPPPLLVLADEIIE